MAQAPLAGTTVLNANKQSSERIGRFLKMHANKREEIKEVWAGDIAAAVGLNQASTGDTICDQQSIAGDPFLKIGMMTSWSLLWLIAPSQLYGSFSRMTSPSSSVPS